MKLYLLRHGHALSATEAKVASDADRPLSDQGLADVSRMALYLSSRGVVPNLILHSPLKRARQTAAHARSAWPSHPAIEVFDPLANILGPEELLDRLLERSAGVPELLAVGHQPQLGELARHLSDAQFALRPAGVIALETTDKKARTLWAFNPEDLML